MRPDAEGVPPVRSTEPFRGPAAADERSSAAAFFSFWSAAQKERKGMSVLQKAVPTEKPRYRRCCEIYVKAEAEKENVHTA